MTATKSGPGGRGTESVTTDAESSRAMCDTLDTSRASAKRSERGSISVYAIKMMGVSLPRPGQEVLTVNGPERLWVISTRKEPIAVRLETRFETDLIEGGKFTYRIFIASEEIEMGLKLTEQRVMNVIENLDAMSDEQLIETGKDPGLTNHWLSGDWKDPAGPVGTVSPVSASTPAATPREPVPEEGTW